MLYLDIRKLLVKPEVKEHLISWVKLHKPAVSEAVSRWIKDNYLAHESTGKQVTVFKQGTENWNICMRNTNKE